MLLSRDFLKLMQLSSNAHGYHYIEQVLRSLPATLQHGKLPSCETEKWVFTLSETLWVSFGIRTHRLIKQEGSVIDLTDEGRMLSLRMAALFATGRSYSVLDRRRATVAIGS